MSVIPQNKIHSRLFLVFKNFAMRLVPRFYHTLDMSFGCSPSSSTRPINTRALSSTSRRRRLNIEADLEESIHDLQKLLYVFDRRDLSLESLTTLGIDFLENSYDSEE